MAEYDFTAGPRKGKVYKEKYYLRNNKNFIQEAKKYIPINSQWLTKEQFKNYVLSLLDKGIPQIYVLQELPEDLFPYALIFVQNEEENSIYVDKEGIRTKINIGEDNYDAVDITDEVPEEPRNNTIYFVNQPEYKKKDKNTLECEIYVCDNDELKKIEVKGVDIPELEQIKQVVNNIVNYSLKNIYNKILDRNRVVVTDSNGCLDVSGLLASGLENFVLSVTSKCLKNIYNILLTGNKVIVTSNNGYLMASSVSSGDLSNVVTGVTTKSLKNIYNNTVTADRVIISDSSGNLTTSSYTATDVNNVMTGVTTKSLKNVYNNVLSANKNVVTDASGYLTTAEKPHLYAHHYHYDHSGRGEVNFIIYSSKSTELGNSELGTYLKNLGCDESFRAYPANGQNQANGAIVTGIFIKPSGSSFVPYTIWVTSYNIGSMFTEEISNYPGTHFIKIVQIY